MNANIAARLTRGGVLALVLLAPGAVLWAPIVAHGAEQTQSIEDRLRLQLRSTTQQLQALQAGQAQMQAERNAAQARLAELQDQVKNVQSERDRTQEQNKTLAAQQQDVRDRAQGQIQASQQQIGQFKQAYDELLAIAKSKEVERLTLHKQLARTSDELAAVKAKNQRLYALGKEVLQAYEGLSTGSLIKIRQPFATSARVKFDEIGQSYGDKLYENRADAQTAAQPVAPRK